jgi:hypothetical protein
MANTITVTPQHHVTGGRINQVGLLPLSILTTETYATASGGITVDLGPTLDLYEIQHADVILVFGVSTVGHAAVVTKTATDGEYTVKLWNGTTEASDGALNNTLKLYALFSPGANVA